MKKILIFAVAIAMSVAHVTAGVRDGNTTQRTNQKRVSTTSVVERPTTNRANVSTTTRNTIDRSGTASGARSVTGLAGRTTTARATTTPTVSARAATQNQTTISETRTGAAYEECKSAFFTCMDQFCALKNDDYRRCSCSKRVTDMERQRVALTDAGEQLTVFTENLDVVGLTAAQATAMRTASEGENALASDTSASKALLQAIMNSISGGDTSVGGKYSDLNTLNMSYDLTTVFGTDANQIVASYNGQDLYSAVYPQCRRAVADDCNTASLQRAVNAYLMAIEQDCNTVQTAITEKQSHMKSAIREGSAMLDLARVENRRKHNSDDITTCINNVESAILSEEVCGANYHKCLDNGEFIDISTGAPITGVVKFYELGNLLTFTPGVDSANQQLSKRSNNRTFVSNFEKRTKKFAEPALDKCTEIADEVWAEYLDKAMLTIYYAQQSKVAEIKQGCFDFVSKCYTDSDSSITTAMSELMGSGVTMLEPDKIVLTTQMCTDYVDSCNNMFNENGENIITQYVNNRQDTDTLTACRAVVKQCFDKYGGAGYENFYYPYSGLFKSGTAGDWFTLYEDAAPGYKSPCAKQLTQIDACNNSDMIEKAFGGFDLMYTIKEGDDDQNDQLQFTVEDATNPGDAVQRYGIKIGSNDKKMQNRVLRPIGVATEVYNQIIDTLATQCANIQGRFVERQFIKENIYGGKGKNNLCLWYPQNSFDNTNQYENYITLANLYGIFTETSVPDDFTGEDMCPRDYNLNVDTSFWGACLCWENGGRRSKNGKNATCVAEFPVNPTTDEEDTTTTTHANDAVCNYNNTLASGSEISFYDWCTQQSINSYDQVCPYGYKAADGNNETIVCENNSDIFEEQQEYKLLPNPNK